MADDKTLDKEELLELLSTPLDPELDYFDATKSLEAMADHIRGLHRLINFLADTLAVQGKSIIELRKEIVEIKGDLVLHEVPKHEEQSAIIMPPKPKLEIN